MGGGRLAGGNWVKGMYPKASYFCTECGCSSLDYAFSLVSKGVGWGVRGPSGEGRDEGNWEGRVDREWEGAGEFGGGGVCLSLVSKGNLERVGVGWGRRWGRGREKKTKGVGGKGQAGGRKKERGRKRQGRGRSGGVGGGRLAGGTGWRECTLKPPTSVRNMGAAAWTMPSVW